MSKIIFGVLCFIGVGGSFIFLGVRMFISDAKKRERCRWSAKATVCEAVDRLTYHRDVNGCDGGYYSSIYPVLRFDVEGTICEVVPSVGLAQLGCKVGDTLVVHYNRGRPQEIYLEVESRSRVVGGAFIVFGVFLAVGGSILTCIIAV